MKINFVILSHNEPEIFRLLDQLNGHPIFIIDDWSENDHYEKMKKHPSNPTVIRRALNKNFADQRNFAMQFIPEGEWIFSIDADEKFTALTSNEKQMFYAELRETHLEAFQVSRQNLTKKADGTVIRMDEWHVRLFRNYPDRIYWVYRLHEYILGYKEAGKLRNWLIVHNKTEERCSSQHQFYGERFNHQGVDIEKALAVEGFSAEEELRWLAQQAAKRSVIVEIGCWKGRTTRAMADNAHGVVYAVDHFMGSIGEESLITSPEIADGRANVFLNNVADLVVGGRVIPLKMDSTNAAQFFLDAGIQADMIFIDGSHMTDSVLLDIETWSDVLAPGGVFCGHDENWTEVNAALKSINMQYYVPPGTTIWVRK